MTLAVSVGVVGREVISYDLRKVCREELSLLVSFWHWCQRSEEGLHSLLDGFVSCEPEKVASHSAGFREAILDPWFSENWESEKSVLWPGAMSSLKCQQLNSWAVYTGEGCDDWKAVFVNLTLH